MHDTDAIIERAMHDIQIGQTAGAIDKLRDVLTINPNDALAHAFLASCLIGQRRLHAARHEADLAIRLQPEFPFAHRMRGLIAMAENDLDRMGEAMNEAVTLDPDDSDNLIGLARYHRARNDTATARALAEKAIEIEPGDPDAVIFHGELALDEGRLDVAQAAAEVCLKSNAEDTDALVLLGNVRLQSGDVEAARDLALWALQLDADDQDALRLLADIKMRENKLLGLFWRFQTGMARLGPERAMLVLICGFVAYSLARVALIDFGYRQYGNILTMAWLGLCLYTWVGAGIQERMVQKELQRVRMRPDF